ncbi:uncharacterized protein LOC114756614 isoform X2 [Neltuma alba]|uniref:uncharacterized protein LOC114756614 isoform X2 n=1 Tax=Neltuma alba TaxID=207710 RepID=UPI0010A40FD3|nr:uncharacterized protein LOC114756614 isoform X2 [Prosopis alba]
MQTSQYAEDGKNGRSISKTVKETNQIQEEPKSGDSENQATASVWQEFAEITEETSLEIQVKDPTLPLEKKASGTLATKSQLRGTSLHELEDEHKTSESAMQLQQEDLAETKTIKASQKTNVPFDDNVGYNIED